MINKNAKTKHLVLGILVVLLIVLILVLIFVPGNQTGKTIKNSEPIKIGVIDPLSGTSGYLGEYIRNALVISAEDINSKGGINGRPLQLIFEDSQGDTKTAITNYNKLTQIDQTKFVLTTLSHVVLAIAPLAEQDRIINFAVAAAAPSITNAGDYTFRHNVLPQEETDIMAHFLINKGIKKIIVIYVNTESGVSYSESFKKQYESLGGQIILQETYTKGSSDFRTILAKIKELNIKDVFGMCYPDELGTLIKQSKEFGLNLNFYSGYAAESPKLIEIAGQNANGLLVTTFFNLDSPDTLFKRYKQKYIKSYNQEPELYGSVAYDNLRILAEAMSHCKDPKDTECVKQELYKIKDFPGITGSITIDSNGDTRKEVIIKTVKDGKFVLLN